MRTVIDVPGYEDTVRDYVEDTIKLNQSWSFLDEGVINGIILHVDELEDGPADILALKWEVPPVTTHMPFYQTIVVPDSLGKTEIMLLVDSKQNRMVTQIETGEGCKTYTHIGFDGTSEDFHLLMVDLDIPQEDMVVTLDESGDVVGTTVMSHAELCVSKYENGSKATLVDIVRSGLLRRPCDRKPIENELCEWYRSNATNGAVIVEHANTLHARLGRVLDKL